MDEQVRPMNEREKEMYEKMQEAQKAQWAAKVSGEKESPVNTKERPEDTIRRLAKRNEELESSFDDQKIAIDDLVGILRREYTYHALRAEELDRLLSLHPENV